MTVRPIDDLTERLNRIDLLLLRAVRRQRARPSTAAKGEHWGQYITDDEVDAMLLAQGEIDVPVWADVGALDDAIVQTGAHRDRPRPGSRMDELRAAFQLDGDDVDLLLLAAAPEISAGYGRIFAYIHDDVHKPFLTVDLATRVLYASRRERMHLQERLLPGSPLIDQRLLLLSPEAGQGPHALRRLSLPPRLLQWLVRAAPIPLEDGATRIPVQGDPFVPERCREQIARLAEAVPPRSLDPRHPTPPHPVTVAIVGGTTGMREGAAMAMVQATGRPSLVRIEVDRCKRYLEQPAELIRDLQLEGEIPYLVNIPDFSDDPEQRERMMGLGTALAQLPYPIAVGGRDRRALSTMLGGDRPRIDLHLGRTTIAERAGAWTEALDKRGWTGIDIHALASRFSAIGGTTIDRVLDRVRAEVGTRNPTDEQVQSSCRDATRPEFSGLVQHIVPRYTWEDLIVGPKLWSQLRQMEDTLAHQEKVMNEWGLRRLRPRGFGLKALFWGEPGTGKTMCAEVLAGALGYDLYRVDLSSIVSKWVGETEKNLRQVFDAAEGGTSVLLFDEGDAIFGSRGDTKSAQDKYANQEVAYLLQRIETFEGCVIITTNLIDNIDEAFLRRFGAIVEFPAPGAADRTRLWDRALPAEPLRAEPIDTTLLGREIRMSGGYIVNAAIGAAHEAVREGRGLIMRDCAIGVARELEKRRLPVDRVNLGKLFPLVEDLFG